MPHRNARRIPDWITVREASFLTDRSLDALTHLIREGRLRSTSVTGSPDPRLLLVSTADLVRLRLLDVDDEPEPTPVSLDDRRPKPLAVPSETGIARWGKVAAVAVLFMAAAMSGPVRSSVTEFFSSPAAKTWKDKRRPPCFSSSPKRSCESPPGYSPWPSPSPNPSPSPSPDPQPSEPSPPPSPAPSPSSSPMPDHSPQPAPTETRSVSGFVAEGFTVPAGEVWSIDGLVETDGNVVVYGTLVMRPGDTLRFVNVDESAFVGGDTPPVSTDVGLWVEGHGVLDARGTPKVAWNRTGTDPSWSPADELVVTPTATGDFGSDGFASFTMGSPVPEASGHRAEVLNLTRDVNIEGTSGGRAHIRFTSSQPQILEYVGIRHMGPRQMASDGYTHDVAGRNPLHFHMMDDDSRGSVVRGVVVRDAGGHAFVPHMSHGISFVDTIAYNVWNDAYWWPRLPADAPPDKTIPTHDTLYLRAVAALVHAEGAPLGDRLRLAGFDLSGGEGNAIRDSLAVGIQGSRQASGFGWTSGVDGVWQFSGNVAHNNRYDGLFVWQNNDNAHVVENFLTYHNGDVGVEHGAYANVYHYRDALSTDNPVGIRVHALSRGEPLQRWENLTIRAQTPVEIDKHTTEREQINFTRLRLETSGIAVVFNERSGYPSKSVWSHCTVNGRPMQKSDFDLSNAQAGTQVIVQNADGSSFTLNA